MGRPKTTLVSLSHWHIGELLQCPPLLAPAVMGSGAPWSARQLPLRKTRPQGQHTTPGSPLGMTAQLRQSPSPLARHLTSPNTIPQKRSALHPGYLGSGLSSNPHHLLKLGFHLTCQLTQNIVQVAPASDRKKPGSSCTLILIWAL